MHKQIEPELHPPQQVLWRSVIQSTGSTLLWVLILLVLGGLYLSVSAKAARAGRLVMELEAQVDEMKRTYSEVESHHAVATSPHRLSELAASLGYRPAELKDIRFSEVTVSTHEQIFHAPVPRSVRELRNTILSPAFTETLVDVIKRVFSSGGPE